MAGKLRPCLMNPLELAIVHSTDSPLLSPVAVGAIGVIGFMLGNRHGHRV